MSSILLIEPDPFLAGIYASKFEKERMDVEVAESIADAKKKMKISPSGIVIDVALENKAGFNFIEEIRKADKKVPIIALTELGDRESVASAFAAGATNYLIKGHFVPIEAARKVKKIVYGGAE